MKVKKMKLSNVVKQLINILALLVCVFLFIINIVYINNIDNTEFSSIQRSGLGRLFLYIGIIILITIFAFVVNKIKVGKTQKIITTFCLFCLYTFVSFFWVSEAVTIPVADSAQIMKISTCMSGFDTFNGYAYNYMAYYPQQITISALFSGLFSLVGKADYKLIEYLNVICNVGSIGGLLCIVNHFSKKYKINKAIFYIFSMTFLPVIFLTTFVYGDFIGMMFMIWALYTALKFTESKKKRFVFCTSILTAIGCLFRMNYIIFAIAIIIYWVIDIYLQEKFQIKKWLLGVAIIAMFIAIIFIPGSVVKKIYINKYDLDSSKAFSTIPYVYMGMSEGDRGYGWYNNEMGLRVFHMMSDSKEQAENISKGCKEDLIERINYFSNHPIYTIKFYTYKNISMWAEPTMEFGFYNSFIEKDKNIDEYPIAKSVSDGKIKEYAKIYQKALIILILISTVSIIIFNVKEKNNDIILFVLVFLGGFSFHMLWEAKSRYIIPYYISLIPIATIGLSIFIEKLNGLIIKKRKGNVIKL